MTNLLEYYGEDTPESPVPAARKQLASQWIPVSSLCERTDLALPPFDIMHNTVIRQATP